MPKTPKKSPARKALLARRAKQAKEGVVATAEYEQGQRHTIELTTKLRAERLARQAGSVDEKKPKRKATGERSPLS
jgi:hypothetical protein